MPFSMKTDPFYTVFGFSIKMISTAGSVIFEKTFTIVYVVERGLEQSKHIRVINGVGAENTRIIIIEENPSTPPPSC